MAAFEQAPPPELGHGPLTSLPEERQRYEVSRRRIAIAAAVTGGAVLLPVKLGLDWYALDESLNDSLYPITDSPIMTLSHKGLPAEELPFATSGALIYPGLGQHALTARKMAAKLAATYADKRVSHNEYSPQGLIVPEQTAHYMAWERRTGGVDIFCNSMGSITWANVMGERSRQAQRKEAAEPVKPIHTLTFCSSPFDAGDVYQERAVRTIARFGLSGTLTEKFLAKMVLAIGSDARYSNVKELLEAASHQTFDALPPKLWASQIHQLGATGLASFTPAYRGLVTPRTVVMYLRPKNPADDRVVKVDQAATRMREYFTSRFGCQFNEIMMQGAGHADIDKACECAEFEDLLNARSGYI